MERGTRFLLFLAGFCLGITLTVGHQGHLLLSIVCGLFFGALLVIAAVLEAAALEGEALARGSRRLPPPRLEEGPN